MGNVKCISVEPRRMVFCVMDVDGKENEYMRIAHGVWALGSNNGYNVVSRELGERLETSYRLVYMQAIKNVPQG